MCHCLYGTSVGHKMLTYMGGGSVWAYTSVKKEGKIKRMHTEIGMTAYGKRGVKHRKLCFLLFLFCVIFYIIIGRNSSLEVQVVFFNFFFFQII